MEPRTVGKAPKEVLIVASRYKDLVAHRSSMKVADSLLDVLSDHLRALADKAAALALKDGRKTLLERDVAPYTPVPNNPLISGGQVSDSRSEEILIVVSKFKSYVKAAHGMNTSDAIFGRLSDHLRRLATECIKAAARDDRRTILDRDARQAVQALSQPRAS